MLLLVADDQYKAQSGIVLPTGLDQHLVFDKLARKGSMV
jgi:hypothetical protein